MSVIISWIWKQLTDNSKSLSKTVFYLVLLEECFNWGLYSAGWLGTYFYNNITSIVKPNKHPGGSCPPTNVQLFGFVRTKKLA